ncbi:hypothetical protein GCG54_00006509 [Colletotrichum gloeosporioides]|uniref:Uncharacterized protein n=1 Tax=Colletotrichum gloeosporioides TaxID=474922 RepID=A0A8H4CRC0_COLGL|nr:uncharacterized protein GCG54_00006509 [Colletotrichum gloeosporioides]KAF3808643.1 hypothetical protein GCG54_00006509 [Colletotrichum gloeosporioides]
MRKNKKSKKARRHAKLLKRLEIKALSEGDLHLSKTVGPNKNHEDGLHEEDAPSSPVTRLIRLKVTNRASKNTNLTITSIRRDVRQFKDTTSTEIKEMFSDFENKMAMQLHALFKTSMRNEEVIEDINKSVAAQEAHASQQAREMDALRSYNHELLNVLAEEWEDSKTVENELRHALEKIAQNHKAAMKETMDNQRECLRRPIEKAQKGQCG